MDIEYDTSIKDYVFANESEDGLLISKIEKYIIPEDYQELFSIYICRYSTAGPAQLPRVELYVNLDQRIADDLGLDDSTVVDIIYDKYEDHMTTCYILKETSDGGIDVVWQDPKQDDECIDTFGTLKHKIECYILPLVKRVRLCGDDVASLKKRIKELEGLLDKYGIKY